MEVKVLSNIMQVNDNIAREIRNQCTDNKCLCLNMVSSPGSGKTSIIVETVKRLQDKFNIGVIVGDLATAVDAERINETGCAVLQLNTGSACHLDANMIKESLGHFDLKKLDILIIENIGNLVCPAGYDLGEHNRAIVLSIPEGDEKVSKYPVIFRTADVLLINKIDLIELCDFKVERVKQDADKINGKIQTISLSAKTGDGFDDWLNWIQKCYTRIMAT